MNAHQFCTIITEMPFCIGYEVKLKGGVCWACLRVAPSWKMKRHLHHLTLVLIASDEHLSFSQ